jgi:hypothetical protein
MNLQHNQTAGLFGLVRLRTVDSVRRQSPNEMDRGLWLRGHCKTELVLKPAPRPLAEAVPSICTGSNPHPADLRREREGCRLGPPTPSRECHSSLGSNKITSAKRRIERTFEGLVRRKGREAGLEVDCLEPLDAAGTAGRVRLASLTAGGPDARPPSPGDES